VLEQTFEVLAWWVEALDSEWLICRTGQPVPMGIRFDPSDEFSYPVCVNYQCRWNHSEWQTWLWPVDPAILRCGMRQVEIKRRGHPRRRRSWLQRSSIQSPDMPGPVEHPGGAVPGRICDRWV